MESRAVKFLAAQWKEAARRTRDSNKMMDAFEKDHGASSISSSCGIARSKGVQHEDETARSRPPAGTCTARFERRGAANAPLIAAVPELLIALESLVEFVHAALAARPTTTRCSTMKERASRDRKSKKRGRR